MILNVRGGREKRGGWVMAEGFMLDLRCVMGEIALYAAAIYE